MNLTPAIATSLAVCVLCSCSGQKSQTPSGSTNADATSTSAATTAADSRVAVLDYLPNTGQMVILEGAPGSANLVSTNTLIVHFEKSPADMALGDVGGVLIDGTSAIPVRAENIGRARPAAVVRFREAPTLPFRPTLWWRMGNLAPTSTVLNLKEIAPLEKVELQDLSDEQAARARLVAAARELAFLRDEFPTPEIEAALLRGILADTEKLSGDRSRIKEAAEDFRKVVESNQGDRNLAINALIEALQN